MTTIVVGASMCPLRLLIYANLADEFTSAWIVQDEVLRCIRMRTHWIMTHSLSPIS